MLISRPTPGFPYDLTAVDDALLYDESTGIGAYVVPDPDPIRPDEWNDNYEEERESWELLERGEVWGIMILGDDATHHDSCWGVNEAFSAYDPDSYIRAEATAMLDAAVTKFHQSAGWVTI